MAAGLGLSWTVILNLSQPRYFSHQPFQSTSQPPVISPLFLHLIYFLVYSQQFLQTLLLSAELINLLFLSSGAAVSCMALQEGPPSLGVNQSSSSQFTHLPQLTTRLGTYLGSFFFFLSFCSFFPDKDTP